MTWFSAILVYVIVWWLVFFMSLPIGARSYHEAGEDVESGNVESAPMGRLMKNTSHQTMT